MGAYRGLEQFACDIHLWGKNWRYWSIHKSRKRRWTSFYLMHYQRRICFPVLWKIWKYINTNMKLGATNENLPPLLLKNSKHPSALVCIFQWGTLVPRNFKRKKIRLCMGQILMEAWMKRRWQSHIKKMWQLYCLLRAGTDNGVWVLERLLATSVFSKLYNVWSN